MFFSAQWDGICKMRKSNDAPVDKMGCLLLHDKNEKDKPTQRFQSLVALILSTQTHDKQTALAMTSLKKYGLTVDNMCAIFIDDLDKLIKNVSFHCNKSRQIKDTAEHLRNHYGGDVSI